MQYGRAIPGAVVGHRPLQELQVPQYRRIRARMLVLGAAVCPQPPHDLQVPLARRLRARVALKGTAVCMRVLQHREVSTFRRRTDNAVAITPAAPVGPQPLEHRQVAASCRRMAFSLLVKTVKSTYNILAPRAAVHPRPLKQSKVPDPRRCNCRTALHGAPRAAIRPQPMQRRKLPTLHHRRAQPSLRFMDGGANSMHSPKTLHR